MKKLIALIILTITYSAASASSLAQQADSAYNKQEYVKAISLYKEAMTTDGVSPQLYYNLGNAYYRTGKLGQAVINYERALKLDPSMDDARANLRFVNTQIIDKPEDDSTFFDNIHTKVVAWMSPNAWAWTAFVLFLIALGCVALYMFSSNVVARKSGFFGGFIVLIIFAYATVIAAQTASAPFKHNSAIIVTPTANLCTTPGVNSGKGAKIIPLHEGTHVEIVDSMEMPGDTISPLWYEVKINNSTRAWTQASDIEKI